jgi:hypothetical protein
MWQYHIALISLPGFENLGFLNLFSDNGSPLTAPANDLQVQAMRGYALRYKRTQQQILKYNGLVLLINQKDY